MTREIDLYGVFVPDLLVWMVLAFLISVPIRRRLSLAGVYRLVWHRALFDVAVYVLVLGGVTFTAHRLLP